MTAHSTLQQRLLRGALVYAVLLVGGYLFFVNTPCGHWLDGEAYFGRQALNHRVERFDLHILAVVSKAGLLLAAASLIIIGVARHCALVGAVAAAGFGCAVLGTEVLKDLLPWWPLLPGDAFLDSGLQADTYPSGHATTGTSFALSLLLLSPARWRPWLAVAAGGLSATFATGVLFAGWHRPSDSLGALAWSGCCMTLAALGAVRLRGQTKPARAHSGRAALASAGLAVLSAGAMWTLAATAAPAYPHADLPFLTLAALIIACAFALPAWYSWHLQAVDWTIG
ncbi:MAG TPA: phosphatase PAP2 family protein [Chthoniobacterales bacterium]